MNQIAWLNGYIDFGGGEISANAMLKDPPYDIKFMLPQTFESGYKYYIINNFRHFSKEQLQYLSTQNIIMWWHDVLPTPYPDLTRQLAIKAKNNIFLSPLHCSTFADKYDLDILADDINISIIPPFIDMNKFYYNDNPRHRQNICRVGKIYSHKGIDKVLMCLRNDGIKADFYGDGNPLIKYQLEQSLYANYMGDIDHQNIEETYRKYRYFIHMPAEIEAFGRSTMEAKLCGCEIIGNGKIGCLSYRIEDELIEQIKESHSLFWGVIGDCIA